MSVKALKNELLLNWGLVLAVAAALAFCYYGVLTHLFSAWLNHAVYSHGVLIPIVSAYLVWYRKDALLSMKPAPSYFAGALLLIFSIFLHLSGFLGGVLIFQEVSLITSVAGAVLLILGRAFFMALLFPIAYLLFMLTSWDMFTTKLHFPFQLFSASMGAGIMKLLSIPAYRSSVYIELPNITLHVADVCSGVNYLISVAAIGIPLAYIALRSWKRRLLLITGALVLAVLANGLRVALIGVLTYYDMEGDLHGPYHVLHAMFVSVFGYAVLFIGAWLLAERGDAQTKKAADQSIKRRFFIPVRPLVVAFLLLLPVGSFVNFHVNSPVPPRSDLALFADDLAGWTVAGRSNEIMTEGPHREVSKRFRDISGRESTLYVAYYDFQEQGRELVNSHSGSLHANAHVIVLKTPDGERRVNRTVTEVAGVETDVLFWYSINGRTVSGKAAAKGYTILDSITGRTNGAMIMVWGEGMEELAEKAIILTESSI